MISKEELVKYKAGADKVMSGLEFIPAFDHYGIKVSDSFEYDKIKKDLGNIYNEVVLSGRKIATIKKDVLIELLEPKQEETIRRTCIDHISYRVTDYPVVRDSFGEVLSEFSFGATSGFKIRKDNFVIELRNNSLLDSKNDFKS